MVVCPTGNDGDIVVLLVYGVNEPMLDVNSTTIDIWISGPANGSKNGGNIKGFSFIKLIKATVLE